MLNTGILKADIGTTSFYDTIKTNTSSLDYQPVKEADFQPKVLSVLFLVAFYVIVTDPGLSLTTLIHLLG